MALTYEIAKERQRPWGYEYKVVVWDGKTHIKTFTMSYKKPIEEKALATAIDNRIAKIEADLLTEPDLPEETFSKKEVEKLLVKKGYLTKEQSLDDLEVRK